MEEKTAVIKFGGHALDSSELRDAFISGLSRLGELGMHFVIVHGGGPQINAMLGRLSIESQFRDGLRVTDEPVLRAVEMVLCGEVNKEITRSLLKKGLMCAGISGQDGHLLTAVQKNPDLGFVGRVTDVNPSILHCLLNGGFIPVVAPLALDKNCQPLNVNADTAAGAIAGALGADYFVLISDVPGVLDSNGKLIPELDFSAIQKLMDSGVIHGGMIPKVEACRNAILKGCRQALILDGRQPDSLKHYLLDNAPLGTLII